MSYSITIIVSWYVYLFFHFVVKLVPLIKTA